jgi:hypothetical protein
MHLTVEAAKRGAKARLARISLEDEALAAEREANSIASKPAGWDAPLLRDNRPIGIWK